MCEINPRTVEPERAYPGQTFNYIDISCVENESGKFLGATTTEASAAPSRARRQVLPGDVLLSTVRPNLKAFALMESVPERAVASTGFAVLRSSDRILPKFLHEMVRHDDTVAQMVALSGRGAYPSINQQEVASIEIPLPPLAVQQEIVDEIAGYQRVMDGARQVLSSYQPRITVQPEWPMAELSEVCELGRGYAFKSDDYVSEGILNFRVTNIGPDGNPDTSNAKYLPVDFAKS